VGDAGGCQIVVLGGVVVRPFERRRRCMLHQSRRKVDGDRAAAEPCIPFLGLPDALLRANQEPARQQDWKCLKSRP